MRPEVDVYAYVQDLEKHLQLTLFGGRVADPEGAVLLVRGALADGDRDRAAVLARQTQRLAMSMPGDRDMTAAAEHARALVEQDPAALRRAAGRYAAARARASALEDSGNGWAGQGDQDTAATLLTRLTPSTRSSATMTTRPGCGPVACAGTRLHHWTRADRPASAGTA